MKNKTSKRVFALLLSLSMMLGILPFRTSGAPSLAAELSGSDLYELNLTIKQNGTVIPESGAINSELPLRVEIAMAVPVEGDDPIPEKPVRKGDVLTLSLSNSFRIVRGDTIALKMGDVLVGKACSLRS